MQVGALCADRCRRENGATALAPRVYPGGLFFCAPLNTKKAALSGGLHIARPGKRTSLPSTAQLTRHLFQ